MAKLPAYGRELLTARRAGFSPLPSPYHGPGVPGFVMVTDSWEVAKLQRELGRTALVVEAGVEYDWSLVKGLNVWILTSLRMPFLEDAIRGARAAAVVQLNPDTWYQSFVGKTRDRLAGL